MIKSIKRSFSSLTSVSFMGMWGVWGKPLVHVYGIYMIIEFWLPFPFMRVCRLLLDLALTSQANGPIATSTVPTRGTNRQITQVFIALDLLFGEAWTLHTQITWRVFNLTRQKGKDNVEKAKVNQILLPWEKDVVDGKNFANSLCPCEVEWLLRSLHYQHMSLQQSSCCIGRNM